MEGDPETGQGMLTFFVDGVSESVARIIAAGGGALGEVTAFVAPRCSNAKFVFASDPAGTSSPVQPGVKVAGVRQTDDISGGDGPVWMFTSP